MPGPLGSIRARSERRPSDPLCGRPCPRGLAPPLRPPWWARGGIGSCGRWGWDRGRLGGAFRAGVTGADRGLPLLPDTGR